MSIIDSYNMVKITEEMLLTTLKESVIKNIVDRMVAEFKDTAEQEVKKEVEKLSIDGVETIRDMAKMRNEVKVYCEWKE